MTVTIIETLPGQWRLVFSDAAGKVLASSSLFPSPDECWLMLERLSSMSATIH